MKGRIARFVIFSVGFLLLLYASRNAMREWKDERTFDSACGLVLLICAFAFFTRKTLLPNRKRGTPASQPTLPPTPPMNTQEQLDHLAALQRNELRKAIEEAIANATTDPEILMELGRLAKISDEAYFSRHPYLRKAMGEEESEKESLEWRIREHLWNHWAVRCDPLRRMG